MQLRSRGQVPDGGTVVYIADTLGELGALIAHAKWVFMGGSLRPHGGHNLLEPAAFGVPQISGPHTDNFAEEARALVRLGGLVQIRKSQALKHFIGSFKDKEDAYREGARHAQHWVRKQSDMAERYKKRLEEIGVLTVK